MDMHGGPIPHSQTPRGINTAFIHAYLTRGTTGIRASFFVRERWWSTARVRVPNRSHVALAIRSYRKSGKIRKKTGNEFSATDPPFSSWHSWLQLQTFEERVESEFRTWVPTASTGVAKLNDFRASNWDVFSCVIHSPPPRLFRLRLVTKPQWPSCNALTSTRGTRVQLRRWMVWVLKTRRRRSTMAAERSASVWLSRVDSFLRTGSCYKNSVLNIVPNINKSSTGQKRSFSDKWWTVLLDFPIKNCSCSQNKCIYNACLNRTG